MRSALRWTGVLLWLCAMIPFWLIGAIAALMYIPTRAGFQYVWSSAKTLVVRDRAP